MQLPSGGQLKMFLEFENSVLKILVPFAIKDLCKAGFSTLVSIKIKSRNHLEPENDMHAEDILFISQIKKLERKRSTSSS